MFHEDGEGFNYVDKYSDDEDLILERFLEIVKDLVTLVVIVKMRNLILKRFLVSKLRVLVLIVMMRNLISKRFLVRDLMILVLIVMMRSLILKRFLMRELMILVLIVMIRNFIFKRFLVSAEIISKVHDHCHYTDRYRGAAHGICNLRYKTRKDTLVVFHIVL